jgi:hypothetical protein
VSEIHTRNPWEDLTGAKQNGLRSESQLSLIECIEFHKLTFFSVDAAERLKYYLMCSVKKPMKWTIWMHEGGPGKGGPKKGRSAKWCKWCKAADGPFTTHDTSECRRFSKDGSAKDKPTKPFDTAKKP